MARFISKSNILKSKMGKNYGVQLPKYVTQAMLECIRVMMEQGLIHPRSHACDLTAEIAAGAPLKEALEQMVRRNALKETDSIYQRLFPQYKS